MYLNLHPWVYRAAPSHGCPAPSSRPVPHPAWCSICIIFFISTISGHSPRGRHFSPILELRRLRLRDIVPLAQRHTARERWSRDPNPGFLTVPSIVNTHKQLGRTLHGPPSTPPTPPAPAQGPVPCRLGCSGDTVRTVLRSRPTSLGKVGTSSLPATTARASCPLCCLPPTACLPPHSLPAPRSLPAPPPQLAWGCGLVWEWVPGGP